MPPQILESPPSFPSARTKSARLGEQVGQDLGACGGKRRVVRWIARERRDRDQRHNRGVELMRPDIPVRELAVLTGDERIKQHCCDQRIRPRSTRSILVEPILRDPLVCVAVRLPIQAFRALPVEHLVVGREYRRISGTARGKFLTRVVSATTCGESHDGGATGRYWLGDESNSGYPVGSGHIAGLVPIHLHGPVGTLPAPDRIRPVRLRLGDHLLGNFPAERETCVIVARVLQTSLHARPARLFGHGLEGLRFPWEKIAPIQSRQLGLLPHAPRDRMGCWARRARFVSCDCARSGAAGCRSTSIPCRNRRVVHCERDIRVNPMRISGRWSAGKHTCVYQVDPAICWRACVPVLDLLLRLGVVATGQVSEVPQLPASPQVVEVAGRDNPHRTR